MACDSLAEDRPIKKSVRGVIRKISRLYFHGNLATRYCFRLIDALTCS